MNIHASPNSRSRTTKRTCQARLSVALGDEARNFQQAVVDPVQQRHGKAEVAERDADFELPDGLKCGSER
jgi:hypothetical protein